MLTFAGVYLLIIATDPQEVGMRKMSSMETCQAARLSPIYRDPRFRRVECLQGAAIVSESLVGTTIERLRGTLEMFGPYN